MSSAIIVDRFEKFFKPEPGSFLEGYMLSKRSIEDAVRNGGFDTWTILRGGQFATNFVLPAAAFSYPELSRDGIIITAVTQETGFLTIVPEDLGNFALAAFSEPQRFGGHGINVVSERFSIDEIAAMMERISGKNVSVRFRSEEEIEVIKDTNPFIAGQLLTRTMQLWANVEDTKSWGVPLTSFEDFLIKEKEKGNLQKSIGSK